MVSAIFASDIKFSYLKNYSLFDPLLEIVREPVKAYMASVIIIEIYRTINGQLQPAYNFFMLSCRIETTDRWLEQTTLSRNHEIVLMLVYFCSVEVVCCAGYISSKSKARADKTTSLFTWREVPSRSSGRICSEQMICPE